MAGNKKIRMPIKRRPAPSGVLTLLLMWVTAAFLFFEVMAVFFLKNLSLYKRSIKGTIRSEVAKKEMIIVVSAVIIKREIILYLDRI